MDAVDKRTYKETAPEEAHRKGRPYHPFPVVTAGYMKWLSSLGVAININRMESESEFGRGANQDIHGLQLLP